MRGRLPTPLPILKARGSPLAKAREKTEPQPPEGDPSCPECLQGGARAAWEEMVPLLQSMRVFTEADRFALIRLCEYRKRWLDAKKTSAKLSLEGQLARLEQQFGLTPVSRGRVKVDQHGDGGQKKKGEEIESCLRLGRSA